MSQFRRRLLMMMQKAQDIWRDVVITGTGLVVANDTTAGQPVKIFPQGWTEQDSTEGKNLFDKSEIVLSDTTITYMPVNVGDGEYTLSTNYIAPGRNDVFFLPGNVDTGASSSSNGVQHGTSRTVTSENGYVTVALRLGSDGTTSPLDYQIMLNEGSTALPYEPYTGGQSSPSPDYPQPIMNAGKYDEEAQKWEYEIEVGCGQLAEDSVVSHPEGENVPDKIIFSGNITGEYTISLEEVGEVSYTQPGAGIIKITINGKGKIVGKDWLPYTFSGNITEITVFSSSSYIRFTGTIKFMLNPGSTPLPYEPYRTPQTVLITSDRPLTKWDKLEKRNGQWGWAYKSAEVVLDGSVDEAWRYQTDANRKIQFYIALPDALYPYSDPFKEMFYCDTFLTTNNSGAIPKWQVRKGEYKGLSPVFKPSDDIDTIDLFRAFLAENPTTILYVTKEETFAPLSESEQEQMNALRTYYPTTIFSNDQNGFMQIEYRTKYGGES